MTPDDRPRHPDELLDAWLDDRLEADERRAVEAHLASCERCRRQVEVLRATVTAVRTGSPPEPAPPGLAARIAEALDAEDARSAPRPSALPPVRRASPPWRWVAAAAVAVVVAAVALWLGPLGHRGPRPGVEPGTGTALVAAVGASYADLVRGELSTSFATPEAAVVERRWQGASLGFPARVFDLGAMGFRLAGGGATTLAGRPAAVTAYRGGASELLVCWMFEGTAADLPAAAEVRRTNGFEFHVYRQGERTLVFWLEGEVLCALAGTGDPETVIALAVAKAMAPAARSAT